MPAAAGIIDLLIVGSGIAGMSATVTARQAGLSTLTLERSSASPAATSGLLCLAIVGGAILPYMYGLIADSAGLHTAYFLPAVAYILIVVFAVAATRARTYEHGTASPTAGH